MLQYNIQSYVSEAGHAFTGSLCGRSSFQLCRLRAAASLQVVGGPVKCHNLSVLLCNCSWISCSFSSALHMCQFHWMWTEHKLESRSCQLQTLGILHYSGHWLIYAERWLPLQCVVELMLVLARGLCSSMHLMAAISAVSIYAALRRCPWPMNMYNM